MAFEPDWTEVRGTFRRMTREALLEELALRAEEYTPMARRLLEGEALARGITGAEIAALREPKPPGGSAGAAVDHPQLLTSTMEEEHAREISAALRKAGVPALVRELDMLSLRQAGCEAGRWGVFVPGQRAPEAGRLLDSMLPPGEEEACAEAGCGSCAPPADDGEDPFPEDGDWWKTGGEAGSAEGQGKPEDC